MIDQAVGSTRPDLTVLLMVSREEAIRRVAKRSATLGALEDRFDQEKEAFFLRVDAAYAALAASEPGRIRVVAAEGNPAEVGERIWGVVKNILPATPAPG